MGEVYRVRDARLGRDVAIKALPTEVARDADRLVRFRREAHLLASLNHPHVASVHGLEELDGHLLLVMELVEGEDLAQRLKRGAIPIDEALEIARQIAEALEEAHEHGIVHRDLKPANIKLTPDGKVKVLDFGLAKAYAGDGASNAPDASHSPTLTKAGSESGVILGTAAYMSPEQARGKPVDRRADIWAFGVVLFEMLTGKRLFHGETTSDTLAAVLKTDPNWNLLPAETPLRIRELLRQCLTRDPHERLRDIGDARISIEEALRQPAESVPLQARSALHLRWVAPLFALAGVAIGVLLAGGPLSKPAAGPARAWYPKRLNLALPPEFQIGNLANENNALAISPDARRVVIGEGTKLHIRDLDQLAPTPLLDDASDPFFSPDGRWLGFWRKTRLWRQPLKGGKPSLICDAPWAQGVSWGEDDTILFAPSNVGGLSRVPAAGGTPNVVTEPSKDKGEVSFRWPQILPGGKAAVFTVVYASGEKTIALLSLETWTWRPLFKDGTRPRYAAGHLFFLRGGSLMAVPFAPPWHDSSAPPVPVLEDVWTDPDTGFAYLDVSTDGSLVYVPEPGDDLDTRLAWVDRDGNMTALPQKQLPYWMVALSPDGKRLAAAVQGREPGVWVGDLGRGAWTRLTAGRAAGIAWTPDGKRVVYSAGDGRGASNAFWIPADGSGSAEQLTFGAGQVVPDFVTPDGKTLVYEAQTAATGWDLMSLSLVGDRQPRPFLAGPSHERFASISSDARWIAYASDESGEEAVYVRRFDGSGGKWRMAPSSGWAPIWARNGRELFYREGQKMMVVSVKTEPEFTAAAPRVLFEISTAWPAFDVSSDGAHFIIIDQQQKMPPQLVVIPDWLDELKVKMQAAAN